MSFSALEIGSSYLRAINLSEGGKVLKINSLAFEELEPGVIVDGSLVKVANFEVALKRLVKNSKHFGNRWIVSLPQEAIFTTYQTFPNLSAENLKEAVTINGHTFLPGKSEDIYWGFQEIGPASEQGKIKVAISSVSKATLNHYLSVFAKLGLIAVAVEPKAFSISRVLSKMTRALVLDGNFSAGLCDATVAVVEEGKPRLAKDFHLKESEDLSLEIKKIINFYLTENKGKTLDDLLIVGNFPDSLEENLKNQFNLKLRQPPELFKKLQTKNLSLALFGAGLRTLADPQDDDNLSLLPVGTSEAFDEKRTLNFWQGLTEITIVTAGLFVLLFLGTFLFLKILDRNLGGQLTGLNASTKASTVTASTAKEISQLNPKLQAEAKLEDEAAYYSPIIGKIAELVPPTMNLTQISLAKVGGPISLIGEVKSQDILVAFREDLLKQSFTESLQVANFAQIAENKISFNLNLNLKKNALIKAK